MAQMHVLEQQLDMGMPLLTTGTYALVQHDNLHCRLLLQAYHGAVAEAIADVVM